MFDLARPDAEPDYLTESAGLAHEGTVKSVVWVGDHTGVSAGEDGLVKYVYFSTTRRLKLNPRRWWDLRTRQLTNKINFSNPITSMELSAQTGRLVITSGTTVAFVPALPNSNGKAHSLNLAYAPSSATIHPIWQDRFVTGNTGDEWVRIHSMDGDEREVLKGHHGPVHSVEYSPDGEMFASGSGTSYAMSLMRLLIALQRTVCRAISIITQLFLTFCRDDSAVADHAWQDVRTVAGTGLS